MKALLAKFLSKDNLKYLVLQRVLKKKSSEV